METKTAAASSPSISTQAPAPTAHTPGPWRHSKKGNFGNLVEGPTGVSQYEGDDGFRAVATVQACTASPRASVLDANQAANIALVAAAPDLLEALRSAERSWTKACEAYEFVPGSYSFSAMTDCANARDTARAAIAKATGTASRTDGRSLTEERE
jgi:hypothetical protein